MSCSSPFTFSSVVDAVTYSEQMSVSGSLSVPAYVATVSVCSICWNDGWCSDCCKYKTCIPWCCCWNYNGPGFCGAASWSWCDCSNVEFDAIPAFTVSASATMPFTILAETGYTFSTTAPATPYESTSVEINQFTISVSVDGTPVDLAIPVTFTLTQTNGSYYTTIPLYTFTYKTDTINLTVAVNILLCLTPVPPMTWVNLQLECTLDFGGYVESFKVACPLTDVE